MAQFWIQDSDFASLKDKVAVITGGSSGIGLATVQLLLDTGAYVVVGDRNDPPIQHDNLTFVQTDVTSWESLKALFKTAETKHSRIDHVFSNAGISGRANYLESTFDANGELEEPSNMVYDINLRGMINTSYLGLHYFQKQSPPGGSIVCTASGSSFQQFAVWDYTTAKHGVLGWMRGAIPNLISQKLPIRINCIGPSWTLTGLVPKEITDAAGVETQTPDVVARQVATLFADESRQGQFIYSSGGRHYEIEQNVLLPAAWKVNLAGGLKEGDSEQGQLERISKAAQAHGYQTGIEEKTKAAVADQVEHKESVAGA
ncbi:Momilactone A synthase [Cercospora beticola]|uniref:Momilactone A synthase n=1 Tax=Cercospora beticola TaxID=122368 RepID=A0A2G5HHH2_CERBT|nr:Momilactone A synthase [Cercospora beticola]PIA91945.1 Momilactone A synthase [Cercospora beticola]WPB05955.1 hypothetical protein RHO25_010610 [Cercospora beticola]CAK1365831.1 unnamed protein product [Cercospora beticola]